MTLQFHVNHQSLSLIPTQKNIKVAAHSRNYLKAKFTFQTPDWRNSHERYALFEQGGRTYKRKLGEEGLANNECYVAPEVLHEGAFTVSIYGGNLITSTTETIHVLPSGYTQNIANPDDLLTTPQYIIVGKNVVEDGEMTELAGIVTHRIITDLNGKIHNNELVFLYKNNKFVAAYVGTEYGPQKITGTGAGSINVDQIYNAESEDAQSGIAVAQAEQSAVDKAKEYTDAEVQKLLEDYPPKDGKDGEDGKTPYIQDGYWYIDGVNTGIRAVAQDGEDGKDGYIPIKGVDYFDGINGKDGKDGLTPFVNAEGNWQIGDTDTGVKAVGKDGKDGTDAHIVVDQAYNSQSENAQSGQAVDQAIKSLSVSLNYTMLFEDTLADITKYENKQYTYVPKYKDGTPQGIAVKLFNRTPTVGDVFWGTARTPYNDVVSFTAEVTGIDDANDALFRLLDVTVLHRGATDIVDQKYNPDSNNAQSGVAVELALTGLRNEIAEQDAAILLDAKTYTDHEIKEAVGRVVFDETDPTVPSWAKQPTKPEYTAEEVGAISKDELGAAVELALTGLKNELTEQDVAILHEAQAYTDRKIKEAVNQLVEAFMQTQQANLGT